MVLNKCTFFLKYRPLIQEKKILVQLCCTDLLFYLSKEAPIAQMFLLPPNCPDQVPLNPTIMLWAQVN